MNALAVLRSPATEPPLKRSHLQGSDCGNCGLGVEVNHDFHQTVLDLSPEFTARFPDAESSRSALPNYDLPYLLVPQSGRVLVVGAGTGNDVAAALRHGAAHVDAVEIAPLILGLGRKFHLKCPSITEPSNTAEIRSHLFRSGRRAGSDFVKRRDEAA